MDKAISTDNASDFIKMLVEIGGFRYVDNDHIIRNSMDDSPVGVQTGIPPKNRPIAIFRTGMTVGEYVILNPFSDVLGKCPERALFTSWMRATPGALIRHLVIQILTIGSNKKQDKGYKVNKFVSKWVDKIDKKMIEEAERISGADWASIFYDRDKRVAQLQSNIGYDELKEQLSTKIRKSTWPVFVDILKTLLQLNSSKKPESLIYESKIVSIPKIDAILHLLIDVLERIDDPLKLFTDIEIPVKELKEHLEHLEAYREATKWFASTTTSSNDNDSSDVSKVEAPWDAHSDGGTKPSEVITDFGVQRTPMQEAATIAKLEFPGVIYNPNFGRPGDRPLMDSYGRGTLDSSGVDISQLRPW